MSKITKIGVFDSGLGGLITLKAIRKSLPTLDYVYYGDTKNLPYGDKTEREIFDLTVKGIEMLIKRGCLLIIVACNTASAKALRKIQRSWLPKHYPNVKVLGVIIPTVEDLNPKDFPALLIATRSTIKSKKYPKELSKRYPKLKLDSIAMPTLVPMIENGSLRQATEEVQNIILKARKNYKTLILGCTHYSLLTNLLQKKLTNLKIISQNVVIPRKLKSYLSKHPEIEKRLSKNNSIKIHFSQKTSLNKKLSKEWFS